MNRLPLATLAAALTAAVLAACGTAAQDASNTNSGRSDSFMAFSSTRPPHAIARCLTSRLSRVDERSGPGYTELGLGRSSNGYAWLVTLMPAGGGSNVKVEKVIDDESVSEPELRFAIARCTT
ncbi:MAG TPA: sugar ABC transporter ATPase [Trinickia sp.]